MQTSLSRSPLADIGPISERVPAVEAKAAGPAPARVWLIRSRCTGIINIRIGEFLLA
jgi:hypothetical protein